MLCRKHKHALCQNVALSMRTLNKKHVKYVTLTEELCHAICFNFHTGLMETLNGPLNYSNTLNGSFQKGKYFRV
jgi:hypothetical protein